MRRLALLLAIALTSSAAAQPPGSTDIPQISSSAEGQASQTQIEQQQSDALPVQISKGADSAPHQSQLTSAAQSDEQTPQVSSAPRNAQPPNPLSRPEQGRTAAVAKVEGRDRCDPANASDKKLPECRHVIETRSADYARPSPTELSPEQKLMIDQQLLASEDSLSSATRRLANSGDPNSIEAMGVASVVLTQNQPEAQKKPELDPQADAAIQAIISTLNVAPPQ
ncbi:MAG: hypothetical protein ACTHN4_06500 [Sphingomicrobium sp.]